MTGRWLSHQFCCRNIFLCIRQDTSILAYQHIQILITIPYKFFEKNCRFWNSHFPFHHCPAARKENSNMRPTICSKNNISRTNTHTERVATFNQNPPFETGINWPKLVSNNIYPLSAKQKFDERISQSEATLATMLFCYTKLRCISIVIQFSL